jgi:hypothetical protein
MHRSIFVLFLLLSGNLLLNAQYFPAEGCKLHYRIVGFKFPEHREANRRVLEIAEGYDSTEAIFERNIVKTIQCYNDSQVAEVPYFGHSYTWRVVFFKGSKVIAKSRLHHFETLIIPEVEPEVTRFRVMKPAGKYKDAYVFIDGTRVLYDMNGMPVWFLPYIDSTQAPPADMKLSPAGTITFLLNQQAYEINYKGDVLWKGPNDGLISGFGSERYHHEFTRLECGNYMVLGNEFLTAGVRQPGLNRQPVPQRSREHPKPDGSVNSPMKLPYSTIIEYDKDGNVVWHWRSSKYFIGSDVDNYRPANNRFIDVHENSFFFDEANKNIYVSCRNISRVIKISYPEGRVIMNYGEIFKPGIQPQGTGMFCGQHSCRRSMAGELYLYNNNVCDTASMPKIVVMLEPETSRDTLKKVWEYECTLEIDVPKRFDGGGNVIELPDRSFFVSMNRPYSKIFIVGRDKQVLWSAIPEKYNSDEKKWDMVPVYRASIIDLHKKFEQMLWHK